MTLVTIIIWGTTFISTKILLESFSPIEILFLRFGIGLLALFIVYPTRLKGTTLKQEIMFAGAGLCGVTFYFLLENVALTLTTTSNVGVLVSIAPFFTVIFAHWLLKSEKLSVNFIIGLIVSLIGVFIICFNGNTSLEINPIGDFLAILAAAVWAIYSIITKKSVNLDIILYKLLEEHFSMD